MYVNITPEELADIETAFRAVRIVHTFNASQSANYPQGAKATKQRMLMKRMDTLVGKIKSAPVKEAYAEPLVKKRIVVRGVKE